MGRAKSGPGHRVQDIYSIWAWRILLDGWLAENFHRIRSRYEISTEDDSTASLLLPRFSSVLLFLFFSPSTNPNQSKPFISSHLGREFHQIMLPKRPPKCHLRHEFPPITRHSRGLLRLFGAHQMLRRPQSNRSRQAGPPARFLQWVRPRNLPHQPSPQHVCKIRPFGRSTQTVR